MLFPAKDQIPALHPYGFWSLTMYNDVFLLVDNPLNRYVIRPDQADLTYAADGSLTLYLQAGDTIRCPAGQLAAGARKEHFSVALRTYLPQDVILDGTWFPPGLKKIG